jgi:phage terminase large subunit
MNVQIITPRWALPLLKQNYRYIGIKGGRGSGKSHFVAEWCIEDLIINPANRGVCIREMQNSIKDSSKTLLEDKIKKMGVSHLFKITEKEIKRIVNGQETGRIIFKGMRDTTADAIKSLEGSNWAWVEEAHSLSAKSWMLLRPTIRAENSQIWCTWNPEKPTDPVDSFFVNNPSAKTICIHVNYMDNPFLPDTLLEEAEQDKENDHETYCHVWLGAYNEKSEAKIFNKRVYVREFDIDHTFGQPNQGLDFGFSQDPTAAVRLYIKDETLYISHESGKVGLDLDDTPSFVEDGIADFKRYPTYADNARPESISYLKRHGWPRIQPCEKWPGSVKDGISFLKSYSEIIIHPRCKQTIKEFGLYSYKIDKNTGEITDEIIDKWNHYIDAIRYAIYKIIQRGRKLDYGKMIRDKTNLSS